MNCPNCNTQNKATAKFCMNCGAKLLEEQNVVTPPPLPNTGSELSVPPPLPPLNAQNPSNQTQSQNIQYQNYTNPNHSNLLPVFLVLGGIVAIIGVIAIIAIINANSYEYEEPQTASEYAPYENTDEIEEDAMSASDASDVDWNGGYGEEAVDAAEVTTEFPDPFSQSMDNETEEQIRKNSDINIDWIARDALKYNVDNEHCHWCGNKINKKNFVASFYYRYCSNKCKSEAGE